MDHKPTRRPIWILFFLVPLAIVALAQIVGRSDREAAGSPPGELNPDLAARAEPVRARRDRNGSLLYILAPDRAYKISLRCDTSARSDKSLSPGGGAQAALVAYTVASNPLAGDGYGVYLAASRVERVRYDAWRRGPRPPPLGVYAGPKLLHPEKLGKLPRHQACEALEKAKGNQPPTPGSIIGQERQRRREDPTANTRFQSASRHYREYRAAQERRSGGESPQAPSGCGLEFTTVTQHMIYLDLLVDFHQPGELEPATRWTGTMTGQSVFLKPTAEIDDEITLTFAAASPEVGGSAVQLTAGGWEMCLDVNTDL